MQLKVTGLDSRGYGKSKDLKGNFYRIIGAFPGETIIVKIIKKTRKSVLAVVQQVIEPSKFRINPKDIDSYLNSSAWQAIKLEQENIFKVEILKTEFQNYIKLFNDAEKELIKNVELVSSSEETSWNYRNKAEFQFCISNLFQNSSNFLTDVTSGRETELPCSKISYAFYKPGESGKKIPFKYSSIFSEIINQVADKILGFINQNKIPIESLRYLILRSSKKGVVALLCVHKDLVGNLSNKVQNLLDEKLVGFLLAVPKADSYEILYQIGDCELKENILNKKFHFSFDHFFQVNISIFQKTVQDIIEVLLSLNLGNSNLILVDLFSGVGVIGILLSKYFKEIICIEISKGSKELALKNAQINNINNFEFYESNADKVLKIIQKADVLIVDPPRAGLGKECLNSIKNCLPAYIIYLSCNHETFVKDIVKLKDNYDLKFLKSYNFFPHTPHIECLSILKKRW